MLIIPAIDIIGGRVVRLEQGDFNKEKSYSDDPIQAALKWEKKGAKFLHLVDLDGARNGKMKNVDTIAKIIENIRIDCEIGGGLRDEDEVNYFLKKGAKRVVFGTRVLEDFDYLAKLINKFNKRIAVSIDFKGNKVVKKGWQEETDLEPVELITEMEEIGVKTIIVTDISLDGTLKGPNIDALKKILSATKISIIASGGISSLDDIKRLKAIERKNLEAVIIGKALYEGKIDLEEAIKVAA